MLNTEIEELKKESNRRRLMILLLEKEIKNLKTNNKADMKELLEVNAIIRKQRDELKEEIASLKEEYRRLIENRNNLKVQLEESHDKVRDYTNRLFDSSVEKDKLKKENESLYNAIKEKHNSTNWLRFEKI